MTSNNSSQSMTHGQALIIRQTISAGATMKEHLHRAGWNAEEFAPSSALVAAVERSPELIVICGCDDASANDAIEGLKLDLRTTCIPTVLCQTPAVDVLRIHADIETDLDRFDVPPPFEKHDTLRCNLRFYIPNDCAHIDPLNTKLHKLYMQLGLDSEADHRLTMAVREMVHNAIEWGNRGVSDAHVVVICRIEHQAITIRVRDSGPGFDRNELPHAATSQDPTRHLHVRDSLGLRAGGFGILMTRGLVDELSYNDAGNEVCIVKKIAPSPPAARGT